MDLHCVLQCYIPYCMLTFKFLFHSYLICRTHYLSSWLSRLDYGPLGLCSLAYDITGNQEFWLSVLLTLTHIDYDYDS